MKKVIALLPSLSFYGKERSNLEVFKIIAESNELLILYNKDCVPALKNQLRSFNACAITFPTREAKRYRFFKYFWGLLIANLRLFRICHSFNPDIIYLNSEMNVYDFFFLLKHTHAKIVYRLGDVPAYPTLMGYRFNSYMWKSIVVGKAHTIVCISHFIKSELEKTGRNSVNDKVIYNFPPQRDVLKITNMEKRYHADGILVIGYLGQIRELKGVHILVDAVIAAIKQGMKIILKIAGDLELYPEYSLLLKEKVERASLGTNIFFQGEISDISRFFSEIDVLCVPTIWPEALGNVLVEAKLYHTPIIVFPSGGMPELISHLEDGYICKYKTQKELIQSFNFYLNNKALIETQSEKSFESLEKLGITYKVFLAKWDAVFKEGI